MTREQTRLFWQQERSTDEESQHVKKQDTNTNNPLDAEISRQIPAEGVTHTHIGHHVHASGGRRDTQIRTFIFTHMQRHTQSGVLYECHLSTRDLKNPPRLVELVFNGTSQFFFFALLSAYLPNTHTRFCFTVEVIHHIFHSLAPRSPSQSPHLSSSHLPKHFSHALIVFKRSLSWKRLISSLYWPHVELKLQAALQIWSLDI